MLALLGRVAPIQLSRGQVIVLLAIAGALVLSAVVWAVLEFLFGRGVDLTLRATGRQRPRKSAARAAIDQLEARISRRS
jgi:hypothetical protein